jgi:hypothetical protein
VEVIPEDESSASLLGEKSMKFRSKKDREWGRLQVDVVKRGAGFFESRGTKRELVSSKVDGH